MTTPITPPTELVAQWTEKAEYWEGAYEKDIATQAAQWGADQELEACCQELPGLTNFLRAARRPKPPSLKEQALLAIDTAVADDRLSADVANVVRRALEALPND